MRDGRFPSYWFNSLFYLNIYNIITLSNCFPLQHYLTKWIILISSKRKIIIKVRKKLRATFNNLNKNRD